MNRDIKEIDLDVLQMNKEHFKRDKYVSGMEDELVYSGTYKQLHIASESSLISLKTMNNSISVLRTARRNVNREMDIDEDFDIDVDNEITTVGEVNSIKQVENIKLNSLPMFGLHEKATQTDLTAKDLDNLGYIILASKTYEQVCPLKKLVVNQTDTKGENTMKLNSEEMKFFDPKANFLTIYKKNTYLSTLHKTNFETIHGKNDSTFVKIKRKPEDSILHPIFPKKDFSQVRKQSNSNSRKKSEDIDSYDNFNSFKINNKKKKKK